MSPEFRFIGKHRAILARRVARPGTAVRRVGSGVDLIDIHHDAAAGWLLDAFCVAAFQLQIQPVIDHALLARNRYRRGAVVGGQGRGGLQNIAVDDAVDLFAPRVGIDVEDIQPAAGVGSPVAEGRGEPVAVVIHIGENDFPLLIEIVLTADVTRFRPCFVQRRQQHGRQNRNDCNYDEQFNERKYLLHGEPPLWWCSQRKGNGIRDEARVGSRAAAG